MLSALAGLGLGLLARLWLLTLRIQIHTHPSLQVPASTPWVFALWHGQLLPLLAHRRPRPTVALVSLSADGERLAWGMRWFGVHAERGSSSRAGKVGLAAVVKRLQQGWDAAFAVDGPRGPRGVPHPGALAAARSASAWVVPYAVACSRKVVLRSWDQFEVPLPFCRVAVVLGEPVTDPHRCNPRRLAARIDAAVVLAQEHLRKPIS